MWHDNMPFQVDYHIAVYTHGILPLDASVSTALCVNINLSQLNLS